MGLGNWISEKLNPSQRWIAQSEPVASSREPERSYVYYYEHLEIVNRAVNMIIDDCSEIDYALEEGAAKIGYPAVTGVKRKTLNTILNIQPNPYQDMNAFRRDMVMDFILDGNIFLYYDGQHIYHMPSSRMTIKASTDTYVEKYIFDGKQDYWPDEIIHIKDNNSQSIYRGTSRLRSALRTMQLLKMMRDFQDNFFKNGAVPGLVIKTPDVLSQRIKDRMKQDWRQSYKPQSGGRNPMILDGGMTIDAISNVNFQELDFSESVSANEKVILKALGVPPVLIDSGNNANLRPNHRLYYLETIVPIIKKIGSAYQAFFGFEIYEDVVGIPALQPELRDEAAYFSTLVNTGIITANEARDGIGFKKSEDPEADKLRVPANIAGSAANPSEGGRPKEDEE